MSVTAARVSPYYAAASARMGPAATGMCPHGSTPGACMQCNPALMSGGGGGGGKKNTAGLMTWNEAWATWHALQVAKLRNEDYLKSVTILQLSNAARQQQAAQPLSASWNAMLTALGKYAPALAEFLASPPPAFAAVARGLGQITNGLQTLAANVRQTVMQGLAPLLQVGEKLTAILGDARKLLDDILHHNVEQLKALAARLRLDLLFSHVDGLLKQVMQQFAPHHVFRPLRATGRRIASVLRKIKGLFGNEDEETREQDERKSPAV